MSPARQFSFGPFRLDPNDAGLWRGTQAVALTPKAFAVLQYLLEHVGELVTKDALFGAVWRNVVVSDGALKVCMAEIRRALRDAPRTPQFIKTEHRRGYRFIADVSSPRSEGNDPRPDTGPGPRSPHASALSPHIVGREADIERLQGWLQQAIGGVRQIVFVTGEMGVGKTTLVDRFVQLAAMQAGCWPARGQCVEHYGAGEAYLPVLEAIGALCQEPAHGRVRH